MESAVACSKKAERVSTRASTSGNRFSSRNTRSDAFYAGVEPLSVRRALHNSAGPDPDTNSAPNSSGSAERVRRQPTSARPRNLDPTAAAQEHGVVGKSGRALAGVRREVFYTIPRDVAVSRREILRRCNKEKESPSGAGRERWRRVSNVDDLDAEEQRERPRTLPSIARRSRREAASGTAAHQPGAQGYRKVSRQDILRRRASVDAPVGISRGRGGGGVSHGQEERIESSEAKGSAFARSSAGCPKPRNASRPRNAGWGREDERESRSVCDFLAVTSKLQDITRGLVPRPSTLPKIIHHASRSARIGDDWGNARLTKDAVRKEPPVYGRIRRRKTSLPSNGGTINRGSAVSLNALNCTVGYPKPGTIRIRERAVDVEFRTTTRHLRDPVPDTPYYSATLPLVDVRANPQRGAIYAKVSRRTSKNRQNEDNDGVDVVVDGIEGETDTGRRTMSRKRIIENTRDDSKVDDERARVDRSKESDKSGASEENGGDRRDFRSKDATSRSKSARDRPIENFRSTQREIDSAARFAATLPSCVKSSRKYSTEGTPAPIDRQRKLAKETSASSKRGKEKSIYAKKSARSHVRAYSDANSGRSNSPVATSSIFGFCTGKRKVQSSSKVESASACPTCNVETVSIDKELFPFFFFWQKNTAKIVIIPITMKNCEQFQLV
ncbi:hypothetical protein K0M31_019764 [Melipona bicolor]|uniref:Uncharacterized protein n=1 Tax=Melipona bicolor TaxID=60889 RepID=A0AA40KRI8_9HYME|nr:hypothetical protein K0M31_019764 [Melipona bicolor]